jgi:hypothetical protein
MLPTSKFTVLMTACWVFLAGCATVTPAPGAEQVKLTNKGADVTACTAVGNVHVPRNKDGVVDIASAATEFRNEVVGLGGNAGFVTYGPLGAPSEGVAYRCP